MNKQLLAMVSIMCVLTSTGDDTTSTLEFKTHGYNIQSLKGQADVPNCQALMMFLPHTGGFAPNVNVQIQQYADTMDAYAKLSEQQFKSMGWKLNRKKVDGNKSVLFEYSGSMNGFTLRWHARAVRNGDRVYLVTGTASAAHWDKVSAQIISCVDSFKHES